jgi:acyl-CoA synthetase (AMP-forming)/AMP-acid ligase II
MTEYWRDEEATRAVLKRGRWLAMGDVGCIRDGLLYINSRARDMILVNAENVFPTEIEYRLDAHAEVRESAVIGVEDPVTGQAIRARGRPVSTSPPTLRLVARRCIQGAHAGSSADRLPATRRARSSASSRPTSGGTATERRDREIERTIRRGRTHLIVSRPIEFWPAHPD